MIKHVPFQITGFFLSFNEGERVGKSPVNIKFKLYSRKMLLPVDKISPKKNHHYLSVYYSGLFDKQHCFKEGG